MTMRGLAAVLIGLITATGAQAQTWRLTPDLQSHSALQFKAGDVPEDVVSAILPEIEKVRERVLVPQVTSDNPVLQGAPIDPPNADNIWHTARDANRDGVDEQFFVIAHEEYCTLNECLGVIFDPAPEGSEAAIGPMLGNLKVQMLEGLPLVFTSVVANDDLYTVYSLEDSLRWTGEAWLNFYTSFIVPPPGGEQDKFVSLFAGALDKRREDFILGYLNGEQRRPLSTVFYNKHNLGQVLSADVDINGDGRREWIARFTNKGQCYGNQCRTYVIARPPGGEHIVMANIMTPPEGLYVSNLGHKKLPYLYDTISGVVATQDGFYRFCVTGCIEIRKVIAAFYNRRPIPNRRDYIRDFAKPVEEEAAAVAADEATVDDAVEETTTPAAPEVE